MAGDVIFDGRNLYDLEWITNRPFRYYSIGQPAVNPKLKAKACSMKILPTE